MNANFSERSLFSELGFIAEDFKSREIRKPDWALASLGVMVALGSIVSPEMLAAALRIRFKGSTLDTALELAKQFES